MTTNESAAPADQSRAPRIISVDALRGLIMFTMIFVNDLAGAPESIVPGWMRHYHGKNGMTFVDLVFPAFLFIVGMSIPFSLGSRLGKNEPMGKILFHIITRTLALLLVGIMMVNETPDRTMMGWSGSLWSTLLYLSAILAFCTISPRSKKDGDSVSVRIWRSVGLTLRIAGFGTLAFLAFAFRGADGHRIITLSPFSIHTEWYGILGLIGWTYFVGSITYLLFRGRRPALLAVIALLLCLYVADKGGAFQHFWLSKYVGIGDALGSLASITVAGILLGSILTAPDLTTTRSRTNFGLLYIAGFAAAALLLHPLYGINKNAATPSWCLWACAITASLWLLFHYLCDLQPPGPLPKILAIAGSNVLLAYLLSEMLPSLLDMLHLGSWYASVAQYNLAGAIGRSVLCAISILFVTALLNRFGFRLKL